MDGSEESKELVHIAGCWFGVSKVLRLCSCVLLSPLLPYFSCLFQFPFGSKKK